MRPQTARGAEPRSCPARNWRGAKAWLGSEPVSRPSGGLRLAECPFSRHPFNAVNVANCDGKPTVSKADADVGAESAEERLARPEDPPEDGVTFDVSSHCFSFVQTQSPQGGVASSRKKRTELAHVEMKAMERARSIPKPVGRRRVHARRVSAVSLPALRGTQSDAGELSICSRIPTPFGNVPPVVARRQAPCPRGTIGTERVKGAKGADVDSDAGGLGST